MAMTNCTEKVYLLLDVGGTQIKGAVFDEEGNRKTDITSYPSKSRESADIPRPASTGRRGRFP